MLVLFAMQEELDGEVYHRKPKEYLLGAELAGHVDEQAKIEIDEEERSLALLLTPAAPSDGPSMGDGSRPQLSPAAHIAGTAERVTVAVFDIRDSSTHFPPTTIDQISRYLAVRLAETGRFRVVPRDQLRERLYENKKAGYEVCYDQSCQIELGKAVAAQGSLATDLLKIGDRCAISSSLYDLRTETTRAAASVQTNCTANELMTGIDGLVAKLSAAAMMEPSTPKSGAGSPREKRRGKPTLGVRVRAGPSGSGLEITKIVGGSAAERASLLSGDVVLSIDGRRLSKKADLAAALAGKRAGDLISIIGRRGSTTIRRTVRLGAREP